MPIRDDLLNLCQKLRTEKLEVVCELEQILALNNELADAIVALVKACWLQCRQQKLLSHLVRNQGDLKLENWCAQLVSFERANFRNVASVLPSYSATLTEIFRLILNNSRLVANLLHLVDPALVEEACQLFFNSVYGCCQFVGDEKCLVEVVSVAMRLLLVTTSSTDWKRALRNGRSAVWKLYRALVENLTSVKIFLVSALHEPIMRLISEYNLFLDVDPGKTVMRLSAERISSSSVEDLLQSKDSTAKYRKKIIHQLVVVTQRFIKHIKSSFLCFPSSFAWLLQQLHAMLRLSAKLSPSDCDLVCTELIFTYMICPALANPEAFGIIGDTFISNVARFNLMQVGQILQTLALSPYETVDAKQWDLYQHFDSQVLQNAVYSIINGSSYSGLSSLDEVCRHDSRLSRHMSAMTLDEVDRFVTIIRSVVGSTVAPKEVEGAWNELKQLLDSLPLTLTANSVQQAQTAADEGSQNRTRSNAWLPKSLSLIRTSSDSDSSASMLSEEAPLVLLISISSPPEAVGLVDEYKVISMRQSQVYTTDMSTVKRTRFLVNADSESVCASIDHFDEVASEASASSSADRANNLDMTTLNDNFSDVDGLPASANVSCRGSPTCSGRDTPSSSAPGNSIDNAFDASSQSTSGNSTRVLINGVTLAIPTTKEAAMEERFGKFGIPRPARAQTHSMVSDSWSTDVLASDSELGSDVQYIATAHMCQSGLLPDLVPSHFPTTSRLDLVPAKAGCSSSALVAPSDHSSFCDRSDTWSVSEVTSDSENDPNARADDPQAQMDFESDMYPSTSSFIPTAAPEENGNGWESAISGAKARQRQSSGSSLQSETVDDLAEGGGGGSKDKAATSRTAAMSVNERDEPSAAHPVHSSSSTVLVRSRSNFSSSMAKRLSPHVSRVFNVKMSLSAPANDGAIFRNLKLKSLRGKPTNGSIRSVSSVPQAINASNGPEEARSVDQAESGDQILEKYRSTRPNVVGETSASPTVNNVTVVDSEPRTPYLDVSNLTQCEAFSDAKRKLRVVLSTVDVECLPSIAANSYQHGKERKGSDELVIFLRMLHAETIAKDDAGMAAQVEDLLRLVMLFGGKAISKLLNAVECELSDRNAYLNYLKQSKSSLLQTKSSLKFLLNRVNRQQRLTVQTALQICVRSFIEQQYDPQTKAFVLQFKQLQTQDEKTALLALFLSNVLASVVADPMFQGCTGEQQSYMEVCIERDVMNRIYFSALYPNGDADMMRDRLFHDTLSKLGEVISPNHKSLKIAQSYQAECPWPLAQAKLALINVQKTPRDKVKCVLRCCETLMHLLRLSSVSTIMPNADDIVPVLVYVIIKANPEALLSTIQYVNGFYANRLRGEDAYWWTQFCSAVEYTKIMADASS